MEFTDLALLLGSLVIFAIVLAILGTIGGIIKDFYYKITKKPKHPLDRISVENKWQTFREFVESKGYDYETMETTDPSYSKLMAEYRKHYYVS